MWNWIFNGVHEILLPTRTKAALIASLNLIFDHYFRKIESFVSLSPFFLVVPLLDESELTKLIYFWMFTASAWAICCQWPVFQLLSCTVPCRLHLPIKSLKCFYSAVWPLEHSHIGQKLEKWLSGSTVTIAVGWMRVDSINCTENTCEIYYKIYLKWEPQAFLQKYLKPVLNQWRAHFAQKKTEQAVLAGLLGMRVGIDSPLWHFPQSWNFQQT